MWVRAPETLNTSFLDDRGVGPSLGLPTLFPDSYHVGSWVSSRLYRGGALGHTGPVILSSMSVCSGELLGGLSVQNSAEDLQTNPSGRVPSLVSVSHSEITTESEPGRQTPFVRSVGGSVHDPSGGTVLRGGRSDHTVRTTGPKEDSRGLSGKYLIRCARKRNVVVPSLSEPLPGLEDPLVSDFPLSRVCSHPCNYCCKLFE